MTFCVPPEWAIHKAIWTAWPASASDWPEGFDYPRKDIAAMARALADADGDKVKILACGQEAVVSARMMVGDVAEIVPFEYDDIWLRDTGPVFSLDGTGRKHQAEVFGFNAWGGKFDLPNDAKLARRLSDHVGVAARVHPFVLEGGSIDADGEGTLLSTKQCLLNPNRNPGWSAARIEEGVMKAYGARKIIWIEEGLQNDHTDGHIDNLARFVGPGHVVCQKASGADDPNAEALRDIEQCLRSSTDASGRLLRVTAIPSPGKAQNLGGMIVPASHMNFIIGNKTVVVPVYNDYGKEAVAALADVFPGRKVVGVSSFGLLTAGSSGLEGGGGSFHCITQQEPA